MPFLGDILTSAPADLTERLLDAFDVQAIYNRDKHQVTIHATITDATPKTIRDLLADPRYHHNRGPAAKITLTIQPGTLGRPPGPALGRFGVEGGFFAG